MLTARRFYIDRFLSKYKYLIKDSIIDVGGSKKASRGFFELTKKMKKRRKRRNEEQTKITKLKGPRIMCLNENQRSSL